MKSKFSGNFLTNFFNNLLCILSVIFTLGIGTPWAICKKERWIAEHTFIDGKQLVFDGTGHQLFWKFIGWFFLSIITLGIYSVWSDLKFRRWVTSHQHFAKTSK